MYKPSLQFPLSTIKKQRNKTQNTKLYFLLSKKWTKQPKPRYQKPNFYLQNMKNTEFQDVGHAQFGDQVVQLQNSTTILLFILTKKCNFSEWMCVEEMSVFEFFEGIKETPDPYKVKRKFTRLGNEWTCCQRKREILWEREKMLKWSIST